MATITRGGVTLTPALVLGWSLTRESRTVVHPILGTDDVEITDRDPGPRTGTLVALFTDAAAAWAAEAALCTVGGPWTWEVEGLPDPLVAARTGDVTVEALTDPGTVWAVRVGVTEVTG